MELVGADADFRPQAKLKAVGKARAGVHHHAGRIHLAQELLGVHVVARQDRIGVVTAVAVDVRNGFIHPRHHLHADDGGQVFLAPVLLRRGHQLGPGHRLQDGQRLRAAAHLHALGGIHRANLGQKVRRHAARHQQAFARVAGAVFVGLGVVGHLHRHGDVAGVVHIGVAIAIQMLDDGHLGIAADALDEPLAATRNDHVHKLRHGDELAHGLAVGGLHQLHRVLWQTRLG